jgi:hypothetical protein
MIPINPEHLVYPGPWYENFNAWHCLFWATLRYLALRLERLEQQNRERLVRRFEQTRYNRTRR